MADLYVHAATVEVECMTVLEAMGCGLPLLIADSPKSATKQFALDDRSLFPCNDAQKLSEKIDYWVEHPAELKEVRTTLPGVLTKLSHREFVCKTCWHLQGIRNFRSYIKFSKR